MYYKDPFDIVIAAEQDFIDSMTNTYYEEPDYETYQYSKTGKIQIFSNLLSNELPF